MPFVYCNSATSAIRMFANCESLSIIPDRFEFPNVVSVAGLEGGLVELFLNCMSMTTAPTIVANNCLSIANIFKGCENLINVPNEFSFPAVRTASGVFQDCKKLQTAPSRLNLPNATTFENMFNGCISLVIAPSSKSTDKFEFANVTAIVNMFKDCAALQTPPVEFVFPKVTYAYGLFSGCSALQEAPRKIELATGINLSEMFAKCTSLVDAPETFTAPNATDISSMFAYCSSLQEIGNLSFPSATNASQMFYHDSALRTVGEINLPNVTKTAYMFEDCTNLETVGKITVKTASLEILPGCPNIVTLHYPVCTTGYFSQAQTINQKLLRTVTGEIDCYATSDAVTRLVASPYISGVLTLKAPRAAIVINNKNEITGVRITDAQTTMNNITVSNCGLSESAVNQLFTDLPTISAARTVSVAGNPGASSCNASIARNKGWTVVTA